MRSEKPFFEVFPKYIPGSEDIKGLLDNATVSRVVMNSERTMVAVYIECPYIIHRDEIYVVQKEMARTFDPKGRTRVVIHEHFRLSSQYNAESFYNEYKGSIGYELKVSHPIMYSIYHSSVKSFPESDRLHIVMPDTVVAHDTADELEEFLTGIFTDRAGLKCSVRIEYEKAETAPERLEAERRVQQEIAVISGRLAKAKEAPKETKAAYARRTPGRTWNGTMRICCHALGRKGKPQKGCPDTVKTCRNGLQIS